MVACNNQGQTLLPPEQHLPAEMLKDHIKRSKTRTSPGTVMLEQAVRSSSLLSNIVESGNSSIPRERQSQLKKMSLALQDESWHAITDSTDLSQKNQDFSPVLLLTFEVAHLVLPTPVASCSPFRL